MTLNEFINHIKHNSLELRIHFVCDTEPLWLCDIGSFKTSVIKSHIGECKISIIHPLSKGFKIEIYKEGAK